jgi:hypothetical protein
MRVADDRVLDGVVFIGVVDDRGRFVPLGTGFYTVKSDGGYLFQQVVTARHVIDQIAGDKVYLRANLKAGGTEVFISLKADWTFHPNVPHGQYIDIAVLPSHVPPDKFDIKHMNIEADMLTSAAVDEQNIGIGDEVFFVGLFTNHYGQSRNIPVVRCGTLAAMPHEPMETEYGFIEGYLVEARSLGGLSGSPVFTQSSLWGVRADGSVTMRHGKIWYFLGVFCGHWLVQNPEDAVAVKDGTRETGNINTGMGIVVPASKVLETIDQPLLAARRGEIVQANRNKSRPS